MNLLCLDSLNNRPDHIAPHLCYSLLVIFLVGGVVNLWLPLVHDIVIVVQWREHAENYVEDSSVVVD